jgi:hypothetical protein
MNSHILESEKQISKSERLTNLFGYAALISVSLFVLLVFSFGFTLVYKMWI